LQIRLFVLKGERDARSLGPTEAHEPGRRGGGEWGLNRKKTPSDVKKVEKHVWGTIL